MRCSVPEARTTTASATGNAPGAGLPGNFLPDFCAPLAVLVVVLVAALLAVVLSLARHGAVTAPTGDVALAFWADLAATSWVLLWIGLGSAAGLCALRRATRQAGVRRVAAGALLCIVGITVVVSWGAAQVASSGMLGLTSNGEPFGAQLGANSQATLAFVLRNALLALVVGSLLLRYLYVTHEWRRNVEAEGRARVRALQARIRPHFLFNSMNTIAALTRSDPAKAEAAVEDLADLFRASLASHRDHVTLGEELEVARTYARIESERLGERVNFDWQLDALPSRALVPSLVLQPLLENAVYHGIERLPEGGTVVVRGGMEGAVAWITVDNPVAAAGDGAAPRTGHQEALANIRERLALLYGPRARLQTEESAGRFTARLQWPVEATP